jgi:hypothetical protein
MQSTKISRLTLIGLGAAVSGGAAMLLITAAVAHAGTWDQALCQNPDGSASTSQGLSGGSLAPLGPDDFNSDQCSPASPAAAGLSSAAAATANGAEYLEYSPPSGSTLDGGSANVSMWGTASGTASGVAAIYTPALAFDSSDLVFVCSPAWDPCGTPGTYTQDLYSGMIGIPARGGNLYFSASCGGNEGGQCDTDAAFGTTWAEVQLFGADLDLSNSSSPAGSGFSGSLLTPNAHGTANLAFTATDPNGPGVYQVTVRIDGATVYSGTPNSNSGECAAHGTDSAGAWIFDFAQPCPQTETVDIPISTAGLADGTHHLQVFVQDAAQNVSTVLDQSINTENRTTVSSTIGEGSTSSPSAPPPTAYVFKLTKPSKSLAAKTLRRSFHSSSFSVGGTLLNPSGTPVSDVPITIQAGTTSGQGFSTIATGTTDGSGAFKIRVPKGDSRIVRVIAGAGVLAIRESVSPSIALTIQSERGGNLVFTGQVHAQLHGQRPQVTISDVIAHGHWQPFVSGQTHHNGKFRLTYQVPGKLAGYRYKFRATVPSSTWWTSGSSPSQLVTVR